MGQYDNLGRIGFTPFQSGNTVDQNGLNSAVDAALAAQSGGGDNGDGQYGSLAKVLAFLILPKTQLMILGYQKAKKT